MWPFSKTKKITVGYHDSVSIKAEEEQAVSTVFGSTNNFSKELQNVHTLWGQCINFDGEVRNALSTLEGNKMFKNDPLIAEANKNLLSDAKKVLNQCDGMLDIINKYGLDVAGLEEKRLKVMEILNKKSDSVFLSDFLTSFCSMTNGVIGSSNGDPLKKKEIEEWKTNIAKLKTAPELK